MKRILYIFALLVTTCCYAQQNALQVTEDDCPGKLPTSPYYYCECRNTSRPFSFPMDVQVADTMWFSATLEDMKQGLCAYWISNDTIIFDVYAFCSSKAPTITMSVGPNQMREMSVESINKKLEQMGEQAELLGQVLTPRIRVYTAHGRGGQVYCYPYDQGPKSTCDSILQLLPRMTYVCDQPEEVYVLRPGRMSSLGKGFIQWKQKKNLEGTVRLTRNACDGPELAHFTLSDSMRIQMLNPDMMKEIKKAGDSIFVHVSHDSAYVGRLIYRNTITWNDQSIDTTVCQGMGLQLKDTFLTESTVYGGDTLWKKGDTLSLTGYVLTVTPPTPQYDTLRYRAAQLPTTYHNQYIAKNGWGDYDFTIHKAGKCDERYLLHVEHKVDTVVTVVDDTLCLGKTVTYSGVTYSKDTVVKDSVWKNADTWEIRDITLHFVDPEIEYDTISVPSNQMNARGYYYGALGVFVHYGDTMIVKTRKNTCTRWIQLHVGQKINWVQADTTLTLCQGKTMTINNKVYAQDTMIYDSMLVEGDTWLAGNITILFTAPETEYDTIAVTPLQMTPEGYYYTSLGVNVYYGDTLIVKAEQDQCTRWIQLRVDSAAVPVMQIDTTLCLGKTITFGDKTYSTDAVLKDTVLMDTDNWVIRDITLHFSEPETEYDTISVATGQMTSDGYYYAELDVNVYYGDTLIVKTEQDQCTRWIQLHVEATEAIDTIIDSSAAGVYKYLREGIFYIRREGQDYDLLGRPINRQ